MQLLDFGDQAASPPAIPAASGTPGYFTDGTPPATPPSAVHAASLNAMMVEITSVITEFGVALDRTDNGQVADILAARIKGILCGTGSAVSGDTADVSLVAVYRGAADGDRAAVIASSGAVAGGASLTAGGTNTAIIASDGAGNPGIDLDGTNAAIVASTGNGTDSLAITGANNAIIASSGTAADPVTIAGGKSAAIAVEEGVIDGSSNTAVLLACGNCTVESGDSAAAIASGGSQVRGSESAIVASSASETNSGGETSAIVGVNGGVTGTTSQAVLVASENAELAEDNCLAGGYSAVGITPADANQNLTWKIQSATGNMVIDGTYSTAGADYAEYFLGMVGHPVIPAGHFVALHPDPATGELVAVLAGEGDAAVGIKTATPGVVGNNPAQWEGRMLDELGAPVLDAFGGYVRIPDLSDLSVAAPQELVGLLGQIRCYITGPLAAGDRVVPTYFGKGRKAQPGEGGYLVLRLTSPEVALVLVR